MQKGTEGVALSGIEDFIRTDLWRDHFMAPKGHTGNTVNLSGKRTEYAFYNLFFNIVLFAFTEVESFRFGLFIYLKL